MKFFLPFFFLLSSTCFAQTEYPFDHFLVYQFESHSDSTIYKRVYYFTNSKDNSYYAELEELDSLHFKVLLVEQDRLRMDVSLKKSDVYNASNLVISCKSNGVEKIILNSGPGNMHIQKRLTPFTMEAT